MLLGSVAASGGGGYHAGAVHFDGATYLSIVSLAASDNAFVSCSYWLKRNSALGVDAPAIWVSDPQGNYNFAVEIDLGEFPGSNPGFNAIDLFGGGGRFSAKSGNPTDNTWTHYLMSANTQTRQVKIYMNDVDSTTIFHNTGAGFNQVYNGLPFFVFNDDFNNEVIGDAADIWVSPGVNLLDGGGDIPVATRRLFISASGKPVNPSGFPAGPILFSGSAATFRNNQGSGGAFTLTGSISDASTSPSD